MVMKKAYKLLSRNRKKVWFSAALNMLFLLLLLVVTRPYFETNDDITLASFLNLGRPVQDPWTDNANYLFGLVIALCYRVTAQLPWYTLFLYGAAFLSLTLVTWSLMRMYDGWPALMLSGILMTYFGYECYIAVNFTKVAGCAAGAGMFLILISVREEKIIKPGILTGSLLLLMGYMIRPKEGIAACASLAAAALYLLLCIPQLEKGKRLKRFGCYLMSILPAAILVLGATAIDRHALHSSPGRMAYKEYTDVRTRIMDHGFPSYTENHEAFDAMDINENAWQLYRSWNFYDTEKFPVGVMKQVEALQPQKHFSADTVRNFLKQYPDKFFENRIFLVYLFVMVLLILYGRLSLKKIIAVLFNLMTMAALFLYMFYDGRYGLRRVDVGIWWGSILCLMVLLEKGRLHLDYKAAISLLMFGLILEQSVWNPHYRRQTAGERQRQTDMQNSVSMLSSDTSHLYICTAGSYYPTKAYAPLDRIPVGAYSNIITLGGWSAESIPFCAIYQNYGVTNPYRDMINNEAVRLVANNPDQIVQYLRDYYDSECHAEAERKVGQYTVYKIVDS